MTRGSPLIRMLKGMRGRRQASNVEPDTAEGVVKGRSQTSTQALNAVLNGQCGTHCRCVKASHDLMARFELFKAVQFPLSTGRGAGRWKVSSTLRTPQQHSKSSPQLSQLLWLVTLEDCARNPAPAEEIRQLCNYLDLAAKHVCVLQTQCIMQALVTTAASEIRRS